MYLLCPEEVSGTKMIELVDGTFVISTIHEKIWDKERMQVYVVS